MGTAANPAVSRWRWIPHSGKWGGRGKRRKEGEMSGGTLQGQLESEGQ